MRGYLDSHANATFLPSCRVRRPAGPALPRRRRQPLLHVRAPSRPGRPLRAQRQRRLQRLWPGWPCPLPQCGPPACPQPLFPLVGACALKCAVWCPEMRCLVPPASVRPSSLSVALCVFVFCDHVLSLSDQWHYPFISLVPRDSLLGCARSLPLCGPPGCFVFVCLLPSLFSTEGHARSTPIHTSSDVVEPRINRDSQPSPSVPQSVSRAAEPICNPLYQLTDSGLTCAFCGADCGGGAPLDTLYPLPLKQFHLCSMHLPQSLYSKRIDQEQATVLPAAPALLFQRRDSIQN